MFRPAYRALFRPSALSTRRPVHRRFISAARHGEKSTSWKNKAIRLGFAIGMVYYYNTSDVFAEQQSFSLRPKQPEQGFIEESTLTLDSIKPRTREEKETEPSPNSSQPQANVPVPDGQRSLTHPESSSLEVGTGKSPEDLEQEAGQEAAFNPETGEINWDCPCLGGMAHGPCGEEFKAAFSCFVYSKEEPKGIECIDKFKNMQDCFRQHPDVYGSELEDEEPEVEPDVKPEQPAGEVSVASTEVDTPSSAVPSTQTDAASDPNEQSARAKEVRLQMQAARAEESEQAESDDLLPKAWHDTQEKNPETMTQKTEK